MNPLSIPDRMLDRIRNGTLVALNVGSPPAMTARIKFENTPDDSVGEIPDLTNAAVIAVAVTSDGSFVDIVWIDKTELTQKQVNA